MKKLRRNWYKRVYTGVGDDDDRECVYNGVYNPAESYEKKPARSVKMKFFRRRRVGKRVLEKPIWNCSRNKRLFSLAWLSNFADANFANKFDFIGVQKGEKFREQRLIKFTRATVLMKFLNILSNARN